MRHSFLDKKIRTPGSEWNQRGEGRARNTAGPGAPEVIISAVPCVRAGAIVTAPMPVTRFTVWKPRDVAGPVVTAPTPSTDGAVNKAVPTVKAAGTATDPIPL
jgi:hypothetical protein